MLSEPRASLPLGLTWCQLRLEPESLNLLFYPNGTPCGFVPGRSVLSEGFEDLFGQRCRRSWVLAVRRRRIHHRREDLLHSDRTVTQPEFFTAVDPSDVPQEFRDFVNAR